MFHTKVFASKTEIKHAQKLARDAASTPVIALSSADALSGRDLASRAWESAAKAVHRMALKHGLPEIPGFYGMGADGEFLSQYNVNKKMKGRARHGN